MGFMTGNIIKERKRYRNIDKKNMRKLKSVGIAIAARQNV